MTKSIDITIFNEVHLDALFYNSCLFYLKKLIKARVPIVICLKNAQVDFNPQLAIESLNQSAQQIQKLMANAKNFHINSPIYDYNRYEVMQILL